MSAAHSTEIAVGQYAGHLYHVNILQGTYYLCYFCAIQFLNGSMYAGFVVRPFIRAAPFNQQPFLFSQAMAIKNSLCVSHSHRDRGKFPIKSTRYGGVCPTAESLLWFLFSTQRLPFVDHYDPIREFTCRHIHPLPHPPLRLPELWRCKMSLLWGETIRITLSSQTRKFELGWTTVKFLSSGC